MSRRTLARPGMSYVQANGGRVTTYTLDSDVMDAKARIEEEFPDVRCLWDVENEEHLFIATDLHGTEYLIFSCKDFREEAIRTRLHLADETKAKEDVLDAIDKHNAAVEREQDREFSDKIGQVGEKLAWAFGKDGLTHRVKNR